MHTLTIKARLILATNGLLLAAILVLGWVAVRASDRAVEKRLVEDAAANVARLVVRLNLPLTNRLAGDLGEILDAEVVVWVPEKEEVQASSLGQDAVIELADRLAQDGELPREVLINGERYRIGAAALAPGTGGGAVVAVIVSRRELRIAQRQMRRGLPVMLLAVGCLGSVVALLVAGSIYRPVSRISLWVNDMADGALSGAGDARRSPCPVEGPPEIRRLAADVDRLLGQLALLQEEATRKEKLVAVGRFSMAIAHELRNPLSGIQMNAKLVARDLARERGEVDRGLEMVISEADRMRFILDELLATVKTGTDEPVPPSPATCSLTAVVEKVLELMGSRLDGADVIVDFRKPRIDEVACSTIEMEQLLYNLIANAMDALPNGGRIEISARPEADRAVAVAVSDTGDGAGLKSPEDIFSPFITTKKRGAGLGLYVCRRIVEQRGGSIGWFRREGRTVFEFMIPNRPT